MSPTGHAELQLPALPGGGPSPLGSTGGRVSVGGARLSVTVCSNPVGALRSLEVAAQTVKVFTVLVPVRKQDRVSCTCGLAGP